MGRLQPFVMSGILLLGSVVPAVAQDRDRRGPRHDNYYHGVYDGVRGGQYDQRYRDDARRHHHDDGGGIGPGYGALIGGGGGAALGALFGGGVKGALIGGAAGAGIGAIGGKLAQGDDNHNDQRYHHHRR